MFLYFTMPKLSYLQNGRSKNFIRRSESKVILTMPELKLFYAIQVSRQGFPVTYGG